MTIIIACVLLGVFGLILGSFVGATVWRLRARQLVADKKAGEKVNARELKRLEPLVKSSLRSDRSQCLHCGYRLKWYDMVPIVSWITLRGKCRHCHRPIGLLEPLIELGMALFFIGSLLLWPYDLVSSVDIARFIVWIIAGVVMAILFIYDSKWFLLPDKLNWSLVGLGLVSVGIVAIGDGQPVATLVNAAAAVGILSGLYLFLYIVSGGKWIGFGDVKLGIGLALLLADWKLAIIALFAANLLGTLIVAPLLIRKKLTRRSRVPFGPLLISGTVIAQFFGAGLVNWYISLIF